MASSSRRRTAMGANRQRDHLFDDGGRTDVLPAVRRARRFEHVRVRDQGVGARRRSTSELSGARAAPGTK